jgi:hypothetical protein
VLLQKVPRFQNWMQALPHHFANEGFMQALMMSMELTLAETEPRAMFDGDPRVHHEQVALWNKTGIHEFSLGEVPQAPGIIKLGTSKFIADQCPNLSSLYDDKSLLGSIIPVNGYASYPERDGWTRTFLRLPMHYFEFVTPPSVDHMSVASWIRRNTFTHQMQEPLPMYLADYMIKRSLAATHKALQAAILNPEDIVMTSPHRSIIHAD